jgi:hypothetical protein
VGNILALSFSKNIGSKGVNWEFKFQFFLKFLIITFQFRIPRSSSKVDIKNSCAQIKDIDQGDNLSPVPSRSDTVSRSY